MIKKIKSMSNINCSYILFIYGLNINFDLPYAIYNIIARGVQ